MLADATETAVSARSVSDREFDRLMTAFGPFEPGPFVAVAVSGGSDSLSLCLLADRWARRQGGRIVALTVDHGLRAGSSAEAERVGHWLRARAVEHRTLLWSPDGVGQQAAREGRYRLLQDECRRGGILHLLVGHTADDQAETVSFRRSRGSGPDGLAGMAAVRELDQVRLLRPLLRIGRDRLRATLRDSAQPWIDDPSNQDDRFARSRVRKRLAARPAAPALWLRRAALESDRRNRRDDEHNQVLAGLVAVHPGGYATADISLLRHSMAASLLGRIVRTVRGSSFAPSSSRLTEICAQLRAGATRRTIGGCSIAMSRRLVIMREHARISERCPVTAGETVRWDDRFVVTAPRNGEVACLGDTVAVDGFGELPAGARRALPALWCDGTLVGIPAFDSRPETYRSGTTVPFRVRFHPPLPLAGAAFGSMFGVV